MKGLENNQQIKTALIGSLLLSVVLLSGCATTKDSTEIITETVEVPNEEVISEESGNDPYEGFNRTMYDFNEVVDTYVGEPVSSAYRWVMPNIVQTGISNFFNNTKGINVVLNDVLQGKFQQSLEDSGRFLMNSTVGIGGIFDVATHVGLEAHDEDFGQTLATWGVPTGPYLVLPFVGPGSFRAIPGVAVDTLANPITYLGYPIQILAVLNARANADGALKFIDEAALDPYVFTRESYLQWRDYLATDGNPTLEDDISEEDLFSDEEYTVEPIDIGSKKTESVDEATAESK